MRIPDQTGHRLEKQGTTFFKHGPFFAFAVVRPVKQVVKVTVFDVGGGSQSPTDFGCKMRVSGSNALALI
jgi:hypothetical protein